jgi:transcriptional regulator with PAS, ATPase and Fis domain
VLILGETGTGKGVLAKWLHEQSPRRNEPFVDLNCAGLSRELAESDLFGHQKGAFTGAAVQKKGLLEVAHRGALFLDEIGDLDAAVQPKLLKVLEEKMFRRVGDVKSRPVDVRLIAATHRNLEEMAISGEFRQDLLYRINTVTFHLPALRDRREDVPLLADTILADVCLSSGRSRATLTPGAIDRLLGHAWPGNLRELRNVLERALLFNGREDVVEAEHILITHRQELSKERLLSFDEAEKELIVRALSQVGDKVDEAAKLLDVPRSSLYKKIKRYGIRRA